LPSLKEKTEHHGDSSLFHLLPLSTFCIYTPNFVPVGKKVKKQIILLQEKSPFQTT